MAEDATTEVEETEETEETETAQEVEVENPEEEAEESKDSEDDPEWAKRELKKVREEAAERRVKIKELTEQLKVAKTPEEFEQAVKGYEEKVAELERTIALSEFDIPENLLPLLEDRDADYIRKVGPDLSKTAPKSNPKKKDLDDLSGGLDPVKQVKGSELSGKEVAERVPRRR